jgi:FecR protein
LDDLRDPLVLKMRRGLAAALFLGLCAAAAAAAAPADTVGSVSYVEGTVSMVRDGSDIDSVAIGDDLVNFDLVKTGADGKAELAVNAPRLPAMTIRMTSNTQFSLEVATVNGQLESTVGIIGGQVALKVARLLPSQAVRVKSDSAAMGVRGTDFTVTAPESGDVLVTCDEGEVSVTDDQGKDLTAIPGTVVEKIPGESYRTVPVAATGLEEFRTRWRGDRAQFVQANALRFIRANARLYTALSREFMATHQELSRNQNIMRKWAFEDRAGRIGSSAEVERERRTIGALLVRLRHTAFRLERVAFRLERLQALHDSGVGVGTLEDGMTTKVFYAQIDRERQNVRQKLALTRFLTKQYLKRNEGKLP